MASVPATNVSPEWDFAILDRLMQQKPNANTIALEAMIMYSQNKTSVWLQKKSEEEKAMLFKAARNLVPVTKEKYKVRRLEIQNPLEDDSARKQDIAQKQIKKNQEKEKLTNEIGVVGLWTDREQVNDGLDAVTKKTDRLRVLKLQINFWNELLNQLPSNNPLFKFSHCRKQFIVEELKHNLYKLLEEESIRDLQ